MPTATIDVWQFIPGDECWHTYRFAGVIDGKPYCAEVAMEIDGRDAEVTHLWGVDIAPDQFFGDEWDAVMLAMSQNKSLEADMMGRMP